MVVLEEVAVLVLLLLLAGDCVCLAAQSPDGSVLFQEFDCRVVARECLHFVCC